jgi:MoaA/NifB/PqqE/SkfB family radical SAM enzyme
MIDTRMTDTTKLCFHKQVVQDYFDFGLRVPPIHIDAGIAKFCNVACIFCYGKYQEMKLVYIEREALLNLVRDASEIGVKSLAFIGDGEPTCNPHLFDALEFARDYTRLDMSISTNGVRVDSLDRCESILSSCKWMRFCISAGTREGYIKIHQRDYFNRVVFNIQRLMQIRNNQGYPCDVGMQAVYVPGIMDEEMIAEAQLAVDLGVKYFVIKQCSLPDKGESGMSFFDVTAYESPKTLDTLKKCEDLSTSNTQVIIKWNTIAQKGRRDYDGCPSIPFISEISGNGDWFPCGHMFGDKPQFLKYKFGNIHTTRLKDIFASDNYQSILIDMKNNFDCHRQCKGACRQDSTNKFCWDYLHGKVEFKEPGPEIMGVNFI